MSSIAALPIVAASTVVAAPFASHNPDEALVSLGRDLASAWAHETATAEACMAAFDARSANSALHADWQRVEKISDEAYETASAIVRKIEELPAHSLAGLMVKVEAVRWCRSCDLADAELSEAPTDERLLQAMLLDLASIGGLPELPTTISAPRDSRLCSHSADPIFALIEAHKAAENDYAAAVHHHIAMEQMIEKAKRKGSVYANEVTTVATDDPRWTEVCIRLSDASKELDALALRMINEPLASVEGVTALLDYAAAYVDAGNLWPQGITDDDEAHQRFLGQTPWQHYVIANAAEALRGLTGAPTPAGAAVRAKIAA
jgi:hypothetical protein